MASVSNIFQQPYSDLLLILGIFYASKVSLKTAWSLYSAFKTFSWSKILRRDNFVERYGRWAVVTGCTNGIGKSYAYELARRGLNIILISRSIDKLTATAKEIEETYAVATEIMQVDFSKGKIIYSKIATQLKGKDIGVLVNNVGIMYEYPMEFDELTEEAIWDHIHLNISAVTMMTYIVLPEMVQRGRGAIINLSSSSAIRPLPLMAVYSATKAYVEFFSRALSHEYSSKGIVIQTLVPFYIVTAMTRFSSDLQKPSCVVPSAGNFVKSATTTLGHSDYTTGYWSHGLLYGLCKSLPSWFWMKGSFVLHRVLVRKSCQRNRSNITSIVERSTP